MVRFSIKSFSKYNPEQKDKAYKALLILQQVVNSPQFEKRVKSSEFNDDDSPEKIYKTLIGKPNKVKKYTFHLALDPWKKKGIGYTYPGEPTIYTSTRWFNKYDADVIAVHYMHEYCHKMGYEDYHDKIDSVPYKIHGIVEDCM